MKTLEEIIEESRLTIWQAVPSLTNAEMNGMMDFAEIVARKVLEQVVPSEKQDNGLTTKQYGFGKRDGWNECRNAIQSNITTILGK